MQFKQALRHNIFWRVINTLLTFIINLLLVRLLGAAQSGSFYYDVTILSLLVLLQGFSLEAGIVFLGTKNSNDISSITATVFLWVALQTLLSFFVLLFVKVAVSLPLALLFITGNIAVTCLTALFSAHKNFSTPNIISAVINALVTVLLFVLYNAADFYKAYVTTKTPVIIYISGFVVQALVLILFFLKTHPPKLFSLNVDVTIVKKLFSYAAVAFAANVLFFLLTRIDYYFVGKYCTPDALGNYIQVSKLGQLMVLLPSVVATVLFPYTAAENENTYLANTQFYCRIITWLFIPLMLLIAATGFWLFPLLFGDGFDIMYAAMLFYLPGFFALCISTVLAAYTGGRGMIYTNLTASAIALIVVILADVLLIPVCGINGAAIASSLAYFVCMIYLLLRLKQKEYFFITDFFGLKFSDLKKLSSLN